MNTPVPHPVETAIDAIAPNASQPVITTVAPPMQASNAEGKTLADCVESALTGYFEKIGNGTPHNLYQMVLAQIEPPIIKTTLTFSRGNQSKTAILLGLSRGTLRKKLKKYGIDSHEFGNIV